MAKPKVSDGVTAFIDILRMSERLKSATNLAGEQELKEIQRGFDLSSNALTKQSRRLQQEGAGLLDSVVIHLP